MVKTKNILILLLLFTCLIGLINPVSAANGDVTITTPASADFSIDEPDNQIFTVAIVNDDPTNLTYTVYWYEDSVLQQTTSLTNATSDTWTFVGGAATSGLYNITVISNTTNDARWNMTVNNKIFAGITDVVSATVGILPSVVSLVVGIVPILVTMAIMGLIIGVFGSIVAAIKSGL